MSQGVGLKEITAEITSSMGICVNILPMTENRVETMVTLLESNDEISFQEYFVKHRHNVPVSSVRFNGSAEAKAAPGVIDAINEAEIQNYKSMRRYCRKMKIVLEVKRVQQ